MALGKIEHRGTAVRYRLTEHRLLGRRASTPPASARRAPFIDDDVPRTGGSVGDRCRLRWPACVERSRCDAARSSSARMRRVLRDDRARASSRSAVAEVGRPGGVRRAVPRPTLTLAVAMARRLSPRARRGLQQIVDARLQRRGRLAARLQRCCQRDVALRLSRVPADSEQPRACAFDCGSRRSRHRVRPTRRGLRDPRRARIIARALRAYIGCERGCETPQAVT